ncbi:MAG: sensor histidine kinase [Rhodocyclales bacterium]|nr:sensor histidine kinase [Rhodocyclales bacterium]
MNVHAPTLFAFALAFLLLVAITAFALWSWRSRESLAQRRRAAEQALRTSEDRVKLISGQLPVAMFEYVAAPIPAFRSISDGVSRLLPVSANEILAESAAFFEGIDPDDRAGLTWRDAATPPPRDFAWVGRSHDSGSGQRWLQIRATTGLTASGELAVHGVMLDVSALMETQHALERSRAELRQLASHREERVEQERARLAREFHDELGQVLTTARMQAQLLVRQLPDDAEAARGAARDIETMIGDASRSVKAIASDLRPAALNLGLAAAVEWLAGRVLGPAGVGYQVSIAAAADRLDDGHAIGLFRIVQESLNNIVRHAGASRVHITLGRIDAELHLLVEDDGKGFDAAGVDHATHFGLLGISERVTALGGSLEIDSSPGGGTRLSVCLPLATPESGATDGATP